ncbi:hypothetical protein AB0I35_25705 [Nocardia sp. NPDC050378]|uniref:hypothetical protein n=1 Tax=Nocardia TaxID=1817 RepID=UPI0015EF6FC7|nr:MULTISPECIES: hypothetical protein [Nocardia]MCA2206794.1 hypothetical protein [Nocardia rosealba]
MTLRRKACATALAVAALGTLAAGCAEAEKAVNKGGDTPCSEFTAQDTDKKRTTVTKFLEQERGEDAQIDQNTIDLSIGAIDLMCSAQANPDTPIKEADLTGALVPK